MLPSTNRLFLREFTADDWIAVHRYASDPQVVEWMWWGPNSRDETQQFLAAAAAASQTSPRTDFHFAAIRREDDLLLGTVSLAIRSERDANAELGYCLAPDSQGQGFGREAVSALVTYGFESLGLHRIHAWISPPNMRSRALIEALGFRLEGEALRNAFVRGEWQDSLLYAVVCDEWSVTNAQP
ncbi:MAG: ribosomal-protein-alanine N-acetyltransferase [Hyphomicrobiaceae bacterium]|jgi:ribosomal-protein-alanine N-acetyltransferase